MDAIEYLKEEKRMLKAKGWTRGCLFEIIPEEDKVSAVEQWSKENQPKTYLQDFIEKFPNAPKAVYICDDICRDEIYFGKVCCKPFDVDSCERCWNEEIEENGE